MIKIHQLLIVVSLSILSSKLLGQEKKLAEAHINNSINMILKQDFQQWKNTNYSPFTAKSKMEQIKNETITGMDFIRGYEAFKDYQNLKLKAINYVEKSAQHIDGAESAIEYHAAFTMTDSISGKNYGFIATDIFYNNNQFKGFKLVRAQSLQSKTIDQLWGEFHNESTPQVNSPYTITEDSHYFGNLDGKTILLRWKTSENDTEKTSEITLTQDQNIVELLPKTGDQKHFILLTEPHTGYFEIIKEQQSVKVYYTDVAAKKHKIKWKKKVE